MSWGEFNSQAILHIDGDAFFVSCEQAVNPELAGRPVITGAERGIAAALSYEAKAKGVKRGMTIGEIKKICPEVVIVPSDYETYSLFSKRMFAIIRRFSGIVEEYGIDEGFVDITGLRRPLNMSYEAIGRKIQETIGSELGISVSVGLSSSKVLAKAASKWKKPHGFCMIGRHNREEILGQMTVEKVWGIGPNTVAYLKQFGIVTTLQFANLNEDFVRKNFTKPHQEIWRELRGESVLPLVVAEKHAYASISKVRTFTPPSKDDDFVYGQLVKNLENACIKARRHSLAGKRIIIFLKKQDFTSQAFEGDLSRASAYPQDFLPVVKMIFKKIYEPGSLYRATGVVIADLRADNLIQGTLFEPPLALTRLKRIYERVDELSHKYGKHTVHLGSSLRSELNRQHKGQRGQAPKRRTNLFPGENTRKRLRIPCLS